MIPIEHKKRIEDFANENCVCEESFADIVTSATFGYSLAAKEKDAEIAKLKKYKTECDYKHNDYGALKELLDHAKDFDKTIASLESALKVAEEALEDTSKALFEGDTALITFLPDSAAHKQQTSVCHAHIILSKALQTIRLTREENDKR